MPLSSEILVALLCLTFSQQYDKVLGKSEEVQDATVGMTRGLEVTYEKNMRNFPLFFTPLPYEKEKMVYTYSLQYSKVCH